MTEKQNTGFNSRPVLLLQSIAWYLLGGWFAVSVVLLVMGHHLAPKSSLIGMIIVLATIVSRIIVMAEQFRRAHLHRFALLSYLLLVILIMIAIEKLVTR
jgi:4-hydroxybenzoate polyprenyltransferase